MVSHALMLQDEDPLKANWLALFGAIMSDVSPDHILAVMGIRQAKVYPNRKTHPIQIEDIVRLKSQGMTNKQIGEELGVSATVVFNRLDLAGMTRRRK